RVPISYPPEKFNGNVLSAMCTPDLRGTQGSFSYFTTREISAEKATGGWFRSLVKRGENWHGVLEGPANPGSKKGDALTIEFDLKPAANGAVLEIQGQKVGLPLNEMSPWVTI